MAEFTGTESCMNNERRTRSWDRKFEWADDKRWVLTTEYVRRNRWGWKVPITQSCRNWWKNDKWPIGSPQEGWNVHMTRPPLSPLTFLPNILTPYLQPLWGLHSSYKLCIPGFLHSSNFAGDTTGLYRLHGLQTECKRYGSTKQELNVRKTINKKHKIQWDGYRRTMKKNTVPFYDREWFAPCSAHHSHHYT